MRAKDIILLGAGYAAGRYMKRRSGALMGIGSVSTIYNKLKSGDIIEVKYTSVMGGEKVSRYKVGRRSKFDKGQQERITLANVNNPKGVKAYLYKRKSGAITMGVGDMGVSLKSISKI